MASGAVELDFDGFFQRIRRDHLHIRAVFEDVHDEFLVVGIRDAEFVVTIIYPAALLVGVPGFVGNPAGSVSGKAQDGEEAGEFGAGNFQLVYQCLAADGAASAIEQAVKPVEVVGFAQGGLLISSSEWLASQNLTGIFHVVEQAGRRFALNGHQLGGTDIHDGPSVTSRRGHVSRLFD